MVTDHSLALEKCFENVNIMRKNRLKHPIIMKTVFCIFLPKVFDSRRMKAYKVIMGNFLINNLSIKVEGNNKLSLLAHNG